MAYTWPQPVLGSIIQVVLRMSYAGQRLLNTYHFRLDANANNLTIEGVSNQMNTHFGTAGTGLYATHNAMRDTNNLLEDAQIQFIRPQRFVALGYALNQAGVELGDSVGTELTNVSAVLTRRAVIGTRKGVSNLHIPPVVNGTFVNAGVFDGVFLTKMAAHGNAILGATNIGNGVTLAPVIYHRGSVPESDTIGSFIAQDTIRVMRRRTVRVGI